MKNKSENGEILLIENEGQSRAKEVDIAWLAGLLDGEGSIQLYGKGDQYAHVHCKIRVAMCNGDCISDASRIIEEITYRKPILRANLKIAKTSKYPFHEICVSDQKSCRKLCEALLPYLRGKREQAEIMLSFCLARKASRAITGGRKGCNYSGVEKQLVATMKDALKDSYLRPPCVETERLAPQATA